MNQRIAIPTNEGKLWQHFGKAPQVTIVNVEDGKIVDQKVLQAPEHEHGAMPRFWPNRVALMCFVADWARVLSIY